MEKEFYKSLKSKILKDIAGGKITYDKLDNILREDKEIVLELIATLNKLSLLFNLLNAGCKKSKISFSEI